jgi:hypothetical protein
MKRRENNCEDRNPVDKQHRIKHCAVRRRANVNRQIKDEFQAAAKNLNKIAKIYNMKIKSNGNLWKK